MAGSPGFTIPTATRLSFGSRSIRRSKIQQTGLKISVCHFPPGTSKWNKIEHRLFSFISQNWRGKPLVSHEVIINLIAGTTTSTGMAVESALDTKFLPAGAQGVGPSNGGNQTEARFPPSGAHSRSPALRSELARQPRTRCPRKRRIFESLVS